MHTMFFLILFLVIILYVHVPPFCFFQLTERCVNVLVGTFKETILAECPGMIAANETKSEYSAVYKFRRILFQ